MNAVAEKASASDEFEFLPLQGEVRRGMGLINLIDGR
jgi:hypothetical protein